MFSVLKIVNHPALPSPQPVLICPLQIPALWSPLLVSPLSLSPYLVSPLSLREVTTKNCRPPTFPTVTFTQSTFSCPSSLPQGFVHVGLTIHIKKLKQRKPQPSLITAHLVNKLLVETSFVVVMLISLETVLTTCIKTSVM